MNRTRDYYRHHRRRIIATRLRRYAHLYWAYPPTERQRGMLAKWNWTCDCGACKLAGSEDAYDRRAEKRAVAEAIRDGA